MNEKVEQKDNCIGSEKKQKNIGNYINIDVCKIYASMLANRLRGRRKDKISATESNRV